MGPDLDAGVEHRLSQHTFRAEVVEYEEWSRQSDRYKPDDDKTAYYL